MANYRQDETTAGNHEVKPVQGGEDDEYEYY